MSRRFFTHLPARLRIRAQRAGATFFVMKNHDYFSAEVVNGVFRAGPYVVGMRFAAQEFCTIEFDADGMSGLVRFWHESNRVVGGFETSLLTENQAVEFARSVRGLQGGVKRYEWYGVCVELTDDIVRFERCESAHDAIARSRALKEISDQII